LTTTAAAAAAIKIIVNSLLHPLYALYQFSCLRLCAGVPQIDNSNNNNNKINNSCQGTFCAQTANVPTAGLSHPVEGRQASRSGCDSGLHLH